MTNNQNTGSKPQNNPAEVKNRQLPPTSTSAPMPQVKPPQPKKGN
jgi:hypothetical protein